MLRGWRGRVQIAGRYWDRRVHLRITSITVERRDPHDGNINENRCSRVRGIEPWPAIPDTDYVTPSGAGTLQNKTFDGTSMFSSYLPWAQISTPAAPAAGYLRVYAKTGSSLCWINSSGTENCASAGMGDPGGTGVVVETAPGVTTNRTIVVGRPMSA